MSRLFQYTPAAFGSLMVKLCQDYMASCEQVGPEPDEALLAPVVEKLQALDKK